MATWRVLKRTAPKNGPVFHCGCYSFTALQGLPAHHADPRLAKPVLCGQVNADLALSPITLPAILQSLTGDRAREAAVPSSLRAGMLSLWLNEPFREGK